MSFTENQAHANTFFHQIYKADIIIFILIKG